MPSSLKTLLNRYHTKPRCCCSMGRMWTLLTVPVMRSTLQSAYWYNHFVIADILLLPTTAERHCIVMCVPWAEANLQIVMQCDVRAQGGSHGGPPPPSAGWRGSLQVSQSKVLKQFQSRLKALHAFMVCFIY